MGFFVYDRPARRGAPEVGREVLLRSLREGLDKGRAVALCGGPKIGRTSVLLHLEEVLRERWKRDPKVTKLVPVYLDLGRVGREPAGVLAKKIWETLHRELTDAWVAGGATSEAHPPELTRTKDPWEALKKGCAELIESTRGTPAWCRYAWLIDNADVLLDGQHEAALRYFGSLARESAPGGPSGIILTGGRLVRDSLLERDSPLAGFRLLTLGVLRQSEAEALAKAGLPGTPERVVADVLRLTGRHPYALQRVFAELELQGSDGSVDLALEAARPDLQTLFESLWNEFDLQRGLTYRGAYAAPEHALMQLLLDLNTAVDVRTAEAQLGIKPLKEFAEMLEYIGVAERVLRGDVPYLRPHFELWNQWYGERIQY